MKSIIAVILAASSVLASDPADTERVFAYNPYYPQQTNEVNKLLSTGGWKVKSTALTSDRADHFVVIVLERIPVTQTK